MLLFTIAMADFDTQDILAVVRESDRKGENDDAFFLHVATPGKPPSALHRKVIVPFLKDHGWRKVSYQKTGFRALYFLRKESDETTYNNGRQNLKQLNIHKSSPSNATQLLAMNHRSELKRRIEDYKRQHNLSFHIHLILSRPLDYEEDFAEIANKHENNGV
ncbi:uncharacterized protein LOC120339249 [Styela clava]|uniref:uncharacterized protein LOC120339249 n=1 Tax=Styela clava TaxID=7725 RepID=UPI0019393FD2|nr:uncharacterized protein LOC120339249 [Styela clava]